jgi:hypothetical protein
MKRSVDQPRLDSLISLHPGYDMIMPEPGKLDSWNCQVCGSEATVRRNVLGTTNWASAMANVKNKHDAFTCPHVGQLWHSQALRLIKEREATASPMLASFIQGDLDKLLTKQGLQSQI